MSCIIGRCITASRAIARRPAIVWCIIRRTTDTVIDEKQNARNAGVLLDAAVRPYSTSRNERSCSERLG